MKSNPSYLSRLVCIGLLAGLLSACSDQPRVAELEQELQKLRETPSGRIDPIPEFPETPVPSYNQGDRRDPFTPDRIVSSQPQPIIDTSLAPDPDRKRTPLERWSLNELSLRGTMQIGQQIRALILTPDGELVTVGVGDYLGQDYGRITGISSQKIQLKELTHADHGNWQEREQELKLSR